MKNPGIESLAAGARAIRQAAVELFAAGGFDAVSLTDVAERARVCKANIFHHFESKEALYVAVLREACKGHAEFTEALLPLELSGVEKLRRMVAFDFEQMKREPERMRLVYREILNVGGGKGRRLAEQVFQRNFAAVEALIKQGQERGEFRADLDRSAVAWVLGSVLTMYFQNSEMLLHMPGMKELSRPERYAERIFDLLFRGLLAVVPKARRQGGRT